MKTSVVYILVFMFVIAGNLSAQVWPFEKTDRQIIHQGNLDYANGKFEEAQKAYEKVKLRRPKNDASHFNIGSAAYKAKKYDDAIRYYKEAAEESQDNTLKSGSYYNLGNAYMAKEEYTDAIKAYKKALKLNPEDDDARYNLSYALRQQKQQQKQQQQSKPQEEDNEEQEKPDQMTKDDADNIMNDLDNEEKEHRKDMNNKGREEDLKKDW